MPASPKTAPKKAKSPGRTARMADNAFERLRHAILTGEFHEGDVVREVRLAQQWGIGRTPLREAIRRAAETGYVVLRPNQAPVVRQLTRDDIRQIYALRKVLECFALECAWDHIQPRDLAALDLLADKAQNAPGGKRKFDALFNFDYELHKLWSVRSGNAWLASSLERLLIFQPKYHSGSTSVLGDRIDLLEIAFEDHKKILEAMKQKDRKTAMQALRHHIDHAGNVLVALHPADAS